MANKLLDQLSDALRTRHYSYHTEQAHVDWLLKAPSSPNPYTPATDHCLLTAEGVLRIPVPPL